MRAKRVDANQPEIVRRFRELGFSVAITSDLGKGFPDLVIGRNGFNLLIEIKDGSKPSSAQKLTNAEKRFHDDWGGYPVLIVSCVENCRSVSDMVLAWQKKWNEFNQLTAIAK